MNGAPTILSHNMHIGCFINQAPGYGWTASFLHFEITGRCPLRHRTPLFEFTLNPQHPLTYVDNLRFKGRHYQPDQHRYTYNGGSIPPPLCWLPRWDPMQYPRSYAYHDSAWDDSTDVPGREGEALHGLWIRDVGDPDFRFEELSSQETNTLLMDMAEVEGATNRQAKMIYRGLEWFGRRW